MGQNYTLQYGTASEGDYVLVLKNYMKAPSVIVSAKIINGKAYTVLCVDDKPVVTEKNIICRIPDDLVSQGDKDAIEANYQFSLKRLTRPWHYFIVNGTVGATYYASTEQIKDKKRIAFKTKETKQKIIVEKAHTALGRNWYTDTSIDELKEVTKEEYNIFQKEEK